MWLTTGLTVLWFCRTLTVLYWPTAAVGRQNPTTTCPILTASQKLPKYDPHLQFVQGEADGKGASDIFGCTLPFSSYHPLPSVFMFFDMSLNVYSCELGNFTSKRDVDIWPFRPKISTGTAATLAKQYGRLAILFAVQYGRTVWQYSSAVLKFGPSLGNDKIGGLNFIVPEN